METWKETVPDVNKIEVTDNRVTNIADVTDASVDEKYPTVGAVKTAIDNAVKNLPTEDEKVKQTNDDATDAEKTILLTGVATSGTAGEATYATGVTINPKNKSVTATSFIGALTGNADTATKATQDGDGSVISETYTKKTLFDASIEEINDKMIEAIDVSELSTWLDDETTDASVTA